MAHAETRTNLSSNDRPRGLTWETITQTTRRRQHEARIEAEKGGSLPTPLRVAKLRPCRISGEALAKELAQCFGRMP